MFVAYEVALEIVRELRGVLEVLERHDRDLARQARRAATSIPLNVAEGNRRRGRDRLHLFRVAAGSASEVRAALDVAQAWGYLSEATTGGCRRLIDRELGLLHGLTHAR